MGTLVLRSHDCHRNRLPADALNAFRSSPPEKSSRDDHWRRHTGPPPRQTKPSGKSDGFPGCRLPPSQTKPSPGRNSRGACAAPVRPGRRGRTPDHHCQMVVKVPVRELVMEEVAILKRGQVLGGPPRAAEDRQPLDREEKKPAAAGSDDLELCSTGKLGPDSVILPKQIGVMDQKPQLYAGAGFFTSPPPSSLPLPTSFFAKKDQANTADLATRALRCLLRLDLP